MRLRSASHYFQNQAEYYCASPKNISKEEAQKFANLNPPSAGPSPPQAMPRGRKRASAAGAGSRRRGARRSGRRCGSRRWRRTRRNLPEGCRSERTVRMSNVEVECRMRSCQFLENFWQNSSYSVPQYYFHSTRMKKATRTRRDKITQRTNGRLDSF